MQAHLAPSGANIFYMGETFKERMKRLRLRAGLKSHQAAADAIGCDRGTVSMWEAPSSMVKAVSGEYLIATGRAYKVDPDFINTGKGSDGYPWSPMGASDAASEQAQPSNLDPQIVSVTLRILRDAAKKNNRPFDADGDLAEFLHVYALCSAIPSGRSTPELDSSGSDLGDAPERGYAKDERARIGVPTDGSPKEKVARKVRK